MARKLSYKYNFEKEQKSLSQAKCPISLTVLFFYSIINCIVKTFIFFHKIGVPNIRAYEEKELHKQQENSKRRLEFENQHSRLTNLLEYEQVTIFLTYLSLNAS